jgi:hypothetical protein
MSKNIEERTKLLNECALDTVKRVNVEIEKEGLEARRHKLDLMRFKTAQYNGKQQAAEKVKAKEYDNKVYNATC